MAGLPATATCCVTLLLPAVTKCWPATGATAWRPRPGLVAEEGGGEAAAAVAEKVVAAAVASAMAERAVAGRSGT